MRQRILPELRDRRGRQASEAGKGGPARGRRCHRCRCPKFRTPEDGFRIVVAGVGGTGIVTIGQMLGMAAHLEGKSVITQDATGLAQMGGASWSHIQIAARPETLHAARVDVASADLVIACDAVVGATRRRSRRSSRNAHDGRAQHARDADRGFRQQPGLGVARRALHGGDRRRRRTRVGCTLDAEQAATRALGATVYTNMLLLGYAWQLGRVPLSHAALMRAIALNGVQVESNAAAFEWGRRIAPTRRRCAR